MRLYRWTTYTPKKGEVGTVDDVICPDCRELHSGRDGVFCFWYSSPWYATEECSNCGITTDGEALDHAFPTGAPAVAREATVEEYRDLGYWDARDEGKSCLYGDIRSHQMITLKKDGDQWGAFEDLDEYPECDTAYDYTTWGALIALLTQRPDLADCPVYLWSNGRHWGNATSALNELGPEGEVKS